MRTRRCWTPGGGPGTWTGSGTSRWSSKLVHGGLRYLAHGEVGLARESARERAVLMGTTAPHLVGPLAFLVPDAAGRDVSAVAGLGGALGDGIGGGRLDPRRPARPGWGGVLERTPRSPSCWRP